MRIALVDARRHAACTLKDVAGGFGTVFAIGNSLPARVLAAAKRRIAALPNVTLAYLDALLTAHGAEVEVLEIADVRQLRPADLYLIASSIVDCTLEREVARAARARFGARVGVFGPFAAEVPEFYGDAVDFVVTGDVEGLAERLAAGDVPAGTVAAGLIRELDDLPFPRWDGFDVSRFRYDVVTRRGITLPMQGSRGCAYGCDYCPYLVRSRYRTRSVASLVEEIAFLHRRHGVRGISFRDPLRLFDPAGAEDLLVQLERRGITIRFSMECRTDRLDAALLDVLHRAGLRSLEIGVESADPAVVAARGRRPPAVEHQERVIAHCHRRGIRVIANYLLGLPNDTEEGMRRTIRYARRLNTFAVQFTVATPYPGTALHAEVKDRIFAEDWEQFTGWTNVFHHPTVTPERIHRLRERAYVGYHFRPRYAWRFLRSLMAPA